MLTYRAKQAEQATEGGACGGCDGAGRVMRKTFCKQAVVCTVSAMVTCMAWRTDV